MRISRSPKILIGLLVALGIQSAAGQTDAPSRQEKLSLGLAVKLAIENHPALREAEAAVEAAKAELKQVRANYYPQLSLTGIGKVGLSGATAALGLPGFPGSPFFRNVAYSANWYQTIFDFGRTKRLVGSQRSLADMARLKKAGERERIVRAVRRAYFSVLEARHLERLAGETVDEKKLTLTGVRTYFQAQLRSQLDVRLAEANLAEAKGELIRAQSAQRTAAAALRAAMGVENETSYELEEPAGPVTAPPPLEELLNTAQSNRPDLKAAETKIAVLSSAVGAVASERRPEIRGFAAAGQGRFEGTSVKENQRHGVGALGFFFPFFTGGRLEGSQQEAEAELKGAVAARDLLRQQIRLEVTTAHNQVVETQESIRVEAEQERAAAEALRLAQARFQARLASFVELTTAEVALTRAETSHARARYDYESARADLDFAAGGTTLP